MTTAWSDKQWQQIVKLSVSHRAMRARLVEARSIGADAVLLALRCRWSADALRYRAYAAVRALPGYDLDGQSGVRL